MKIIPINTSITKTKFQVYILAVIIYSLYMRDTKSLITGIILFRAKLVISYLLVLSTMQALPCLRFSYHRSEKHTAFLFLFFCSAFPLLVLLKILFLIIEASVPVVKQLTSSITG